MALLVLQELLVQRVLQVLVESQALLELQVLRERRELAVLQELLVRREQQEPHSQGLEYTRLAALQALDLRSPSRLTRKISTLIRTTIQSRTTAA
jgi:hypothetical protein